MAKDCMFPSRSLSPVLIVDPNSIFSFDTATHVWPASSPYAFPVGPAAPVSLSPHVVLKRFLLVFARSAA